MTPRQGSTVLVRYDQASLGDLTPKTPAEDLSGLLPQSGDAGLSTAAVHSQSITALMASRRESRAYLPYYVGRNQEEIDHLVPGARSEHSIDDDSSSFVHCS